MKQPPPPPNNPLLKLLKTSQDFFSPSKWFGGNEQPLRSQPRISRRDGLLQMRKPMRKGSKVIKRPMAASEYRTFFSSQNRQTTTTTRRPKIEFEELEMLRRILQSQTSTSRPPATTTTTFRPRINPVPTGALADASMPAFPGQTAKISKRKQDLSAQGSIKTYTKVLPKKTYGQGFDPAAVQPETGFKPIVDKAGSMPTLAFNVHDGVPQRPAVEDSQTSETRILPSTRHNAKIGSFSDLLSSVSHFLYIEQHFP